MESAIVDYEKYCISIIDEKEFLTIAKESGIVFQQNIRLLDKEGFRKEGGEARDKDFFGMGYPYLVKLYGSKVIISSDYGVVYIEKEDKQSWWELTINKLIMNSNNPTIRSIYRKCCIWGKKKPVIT